MDAETRDLVKAIEGWLTEREADFLYESAMRCDGRGVILEIGSFEGKSTVCLARGSLAGKHVKVVAIDPHVSELEHRGLGGQSSFNAFTRNIASARMIDLVEPIVARSQEVGRQWDRPIELLWIDGDHTYEGARSDFETYSPFVVPGGLIAFHDSTDGGPVTQVVQEAFRIDNIAQIRLVDSVAAGVKGVGTKDNKDRFLLLFHRHYRSVARLLPLRLLRSYASRVIARL